MKIFFLLLLFLPIVAFGQLRKSYEEKERKGSAIYHYWDGRKYYKVIIKKDYLNIFEENRNKLLYRKPIILYTTLGFILTKEKNGREVLIVSTGGYSEIRYKIFFGKKIFVKTYEPIRSD